MISNYEAKSDLYSEKTSLNDLNKRIKTSKSIFVYYYQKNCSHCKKVAPYLIPLGKKQNDFAMLDLEEHPNGASKMKISATPTLIKYKNGKEEKRIIGEKTENEYEAFFDEN